MLFFRNKLKKICLNLIQDNSKYFKTEMTKLLIECKSKSVVASDEDIEQIYKNANNMYFKNGADIINNSNDSNAKLRWLRIPMQPDVCGVDVDYNHLSIGMIYIMLYFCFTGEEASKKDIQIYTMLNHTNHDIRNVILSQVLEEFSN